MPTLPSSASANVSLRCRGRLPANPTLAWTLKAKVARSPTARLRAHWWTRSLRALLRALSSKHYTLLTRVCSKHVSPTRTRRSYGIPCEDCRPSLRFPLSPRVLSG